MSQDTSAYGVDVRYRTGFWRRPSGEDADDRARGGARRAGARARRVGAAALRLPVSARRRRRSPLMADGSAPRGLLPYLDVPFQHASPRILKLMKRPAAPENMLERTRRVARACARDHRSAARSSSAFPARPRPSSRSCSPSSTKRELDRVGCFAYSPVDGATANALPDPVPEACAKSAARASWPCRRRSARRSSRAASGRRWTCWSTASKRRPDARASRRSPSAAPRPMRRRSTASCASATPRTCAPGTFARVRITGADAHDLTAELA